MCVLIIHFVVLYLLTKLAINAMEHEKWWLAIFLMIVMCVEIVVHARG